MFVFEGVDLYPEAAYQAYWSGMLRLEAANEAHFCHQELEVRGSPAEAGPDSRTLVAYWALSQRGHAISIDPTIVHVTQVTEVTSDDALVAHRSL